MGMKVLLRDLLIHIHIGLNINELILRGVVGELDLGDHFLVALSST